jgi:Rieske Fe-S protein
MAGEDQERFEDYLELERYIEELQAGHAAHPPADLTPERARIYRMAALFRSVSPEAAEPRPEFVASLHDRLLAENAATDEEDTVPRLPVLVPPEPPVVVQVVQKEQEEPTSISRQPSGVVRRARFFSRRSLLGGSAVAAASLVVGAGIGAAFEKSAGEPVGNRVAKPTPSATYSTTSNMPIVPANVAVPHFVTTLAELGSGAAVRFTTDALVGYVILSDGDDGDVPKGEVVAMSASCTHMGCIVQWQDADRSFHCPCHGGIFTEYGEPDSASPISYLKSLPRLKTLIKDGKVYVMVPGSPAKGISV